MLEKSQPLVLIFDDVIKDDSMKIKVWSLYGKLLENKLLILDNFLLKNHHFFQAVENLFALPFLVKDGSVELTIIGNGEHLMFLRLLQQLKIGQEVYMIHNLSFVLIIQSGRGFSRREGILLIQDCC